MCKNFPSCAAALCIVLLHLTPSAAETSEQETTRAAQPEKATAEKTTAETVEGEADAPSATIVQEVHFEFAGPTGDPDTSAGLAAQGKGKAAAQKGEHAEAVSDFEEAYRLAGKSEALSAAMDSYEALAEWVKAHGLAVQHLRDHKPTGVKLQALEKKVAELAGKTAKLRVEVQTSGARVEVDGVVWLERTDATTRTVVGRVSAAPHEVKVTKDGFDSYSKQLELEAGGTATVAADLERTKDPEPPPPPPVPLPPGGLTAAEVKDFCRISIANSGRKYQKQKLVIFDLAGEDVTNGPEKEINAEGKVIAQHQIFQRAEIHAHLRTVYFSTFPSARFFTVKAQTPSSESTLGQKSVSSGDMIRAAGNDAFAAYSLACADWVLMPRVAGKDATWRQVERETTEWRNGQRITRKYMGWDLSVVWDLEAAAYRRQGDQWRLVDTVRGSNGGLLGLAGGLTESLEQMEQAQQAVRDLQAKLTGESKAPKGFPLVSDRPDPSCKVPFVTSALATLESMQQCEKTISDPAAALADASENTQTMLAAEVEQVNGDGGLPTGVDAAGAAKRVADAAQEGARSCQAAVENVVATQQELAQLATPSVKQLDGLFACAGIGASFELPPEALAPGTGQLRTGFCKDIGSEERSGTAFGDASMFNVATCTTRVRMDLSTRDLQKEAHHIPGWKLYAPLDKLPGRDEGGYGLSLGTLEGAKRGHAYIAVHVQDDGSTVPTGAFGRLMTEGPGGDQLSEFRFRKGEEEYGTRMEEFAQIGITLGVGGQGSMFTSAGDLEPGLGKGISLEGGYNASEYVPLADEIWSRLYISGEMGDNKTSFATIEAVPEATFYLVGGLGVFTGTGLSLGIANMKAETGVDATGAPTEEDLSGYSIGATAVAGLDYAWSPEWNVRAGVHYRQGITKAELTNKDETVTVDGGSLSAARANVSAVYTF